jgi:hypothetical protein
MYPRHESGRRCSRLTVLLPWFRLPDPSAALPDHVWKRFEGSVGAQERQSKCGSMRHPCNEFLDFVRVVTYFAPRSGKSDVHGCDGWFPVHTGGKIDRS